MERSEGFNAFLLQADDRNGSGQARGLNRTENPAPGVQ
jgi:hypothetical protein